MNYYEYKLPGVYGRVDATAAGREIERLIEEKGAIRPSDLVERARDPASILHPLFEWDDTVAAEKYRELQAHKLLINIVVVQEPTEELTEIEIRAFIPAAPPSEGRGKGFVTLEIVMQNPEYLEALVKDARRDLAIFQQKYAVLSRETRLAPYFNAITYLRQALDSEYI